MTQAEHKTAQVASNILDRPSKLVTAVVRGQKPIQIMEIRALVMKF